MAHHVSVIVIFSWHTYVHNYKWFHTIILLFSLLYYWAMIEAGSQCIHIVHLSSCWYGEWTKVFCVKVYNILAYTTVPCFARKHQDAKTLCSEDPLNLSLPYLWNSYIGSKGSVSVFQAMNCILKQCFLLLFFSGLFLFVEFTDVQN